MVIGAIACFCCYILTFGLCAGHGTMHSVFSNPKSHLALFKKELLLVLFKRVLLTKESENGLNQSQKYNFTYYPPCS